MKVLFAVNNDDISDAILKKYQKNYKERKATTMIAFL